MQLNVYHATALRIIAINADTLVDDRLWRRDSGDAWSLLAGLRYWVSQLPEYLETILMEGVSEDDPNTLILDRWLENIRGFLAVAHG